MGTPSEQVQDDGKVSFEEFKMLATKGDELHLKTSALWASVRQVGILFLWFCVSCVWSMAGVFYHIRSHSQSRKIFVTSFFSFLLITVPLLFSSFISGYFSGVRIQACDKTHGNVSKQRNFYK